MTTYFTILKSIRPVHALITLFFLLLLFFGKTFSKAELAGPLYLHDVMLLAITGFSVILQPKLKFHFLSIVILVGLAFLYFLGSIVWLGPSSPYFVMVFRQFALFFYLACSYIIFCTQVRDFADGIKATNFIRLMGYLAMATQITFLVYGFLFVPGFSLFGDSDYNYFSPLTIMGIITFCADAITSKKKLPVKSLQFLFGLALSLTLGHSSAFLAVFVILILYVYMMITPMQRLFASIFIILAILPLFFLPQFNDYNASWRLYFWKHILQRSVTEGYLVFGHGFGAGYMTYEYAWFINRVMHSRIMIDDYYPMARHLNPPHNSVLTIIFHIGLIPSLLFFAPLKNFFSQIFVKQFSDDTNTNFLILSLCGSLIWIMFNVILELPHSATYFWLVFFTTAFYLKYNPELESRKNEQ